MSYNGPPPPYSEAAAVPKPNTEQMKPAPGEFGNPYAQPKGRRTPPTSDSYSSDVKVPYSETSQLESGPYPSGTLTYSRNVGSGSYQSPPNSNIGSGAPPGYQVMPSPRMPSAPIGGGVNHGGIYPSVGYAQPPYPTDTFERGVNQPGGPQGYAMPRPSQPNYTRSSSPPLAGRIDQMNISGSPNNYPPGQRPYSPYSQNPGYPPNIGGGASYQSPPNSSIGSGTRYQNSPSPVIGSGASRGYSTPPIGYGTSPGYSNPTIGSGTRGYSPPTSGYPPPRPYPTPYNTPISSNYPPIGGPPMIGGGYSSGVVGYGSGSSCTAIPSSHGGYCPTTNYCGKKPHHSHHHHHC